MTCGNQQSLSTECTVVRTGLSSWRLLREEKPILDDGLLQSLVEWTRCLARGFAAVLAMLGSAMAQEELTAEVVKTPAAHDGTSTFKIRLQFSSPIKTGYKTLRDHSFTVSGGQVTNASRVKKLGRKPTSHEAMTTTLEGGRTCDVESAVYTKDGRILSVPSGKLAGQSPTTTGAPTVSRLESSCPNPFNSTTRIAYSLATGGPVRLTIYSALGQPMRTLVDQVQAAGFYQVYWDGRDLSGAEISMGVYLVRLYYPGGVQIQRLLYLK